MIKSYSINTSYLARLIKNKGLTQVALSKMVPCSSAMVHRWVSGKSQITARKLVALAKALNVQPCDLLEGSDQKTRKYLENVVMKKIVDDQQKMLSYDGDLPEIDHATLMQMMKSLGYVVMPSGGQGGEDPGFNRPDTAAEKQMEEFF